VQQIDIDFEVYKALTARRESEEHTYNEVIRSLLGLKKHNNFLQKILGPEISNPGDHEAALGRFIAGRFLPNGTLLRAKYKSFSHSAEIRDGRWADELGNDFPSASSAAKAITGNNVNGLTFWEAKRPSDNEWRKLSAIPKRSI
jgi:predicted CopG family antitoxin